jgi:hypothetical protein
MGPIKIIATMTTFVVASMPAAANDCDWTNPGAAPYKGTLAQALASYTDIPLLHRAALWVQATAIRPHGYVWITATDDDIGRYSNLRDMHWGQSKCKGLVDRSGWAEGHREPAAVYCSGSYGIAIPAVCGNVARVDCGDLPDPEPQRVTRPEPREEWRPPNRQPDRPQEVPEPGTLALVLLAAGIGVATRKKA